MSNKILNSIVLGCGVSLSTIQAFGQIAVLRETTLNPTEVAIEVKPLPLALSLLPGITSLGLGVELSSGGNAATFLNGYVLDSNLPNGMRSTGRESEVPVIQKLKGYSGDVGFRYYTHTIGVDSWYGGVKVGYSLAQGQWGYQDEQVNSSTRTVTPGLEGGYRWIWTNNMLVRLGAGADANIIQENNTSPVNTATTVTADAEDKIQGYAQVAVLPRLDVGLGYAF